MADEKLKARLGLDNSEFKRGLKDSENKLAGLNASFRNLAGAIGIGFGIHQIVAFGKEAIKLAATTEGVKAGFERIAKPGLLDDLRTATRGAVGDLRLMQMTVQASNFEIPLNQLASLLKFASARAIETGQSMDYLVESIILGIGRKSPRILDNLGISAVRLGEVMKGVAAESATVGEVASAVGQIASEELGKMGDVADSSATEMERLAVASERLKTAWGDFLNKELGPKRQILTWWLETMNEIFSDPNLTEWQKITMHPDKYIQYKKDNPDLYSKPQETSVEPVEKVTIAEQKRVDTIASLNEQLKEEKALLELLDVTDQKGIQTQLQVIDALEKRITNISTLRQENPLISMLSVPKGFTEATNNSWQKLWDDYERFTKIQNKLAGGPEFKEPIDDMTNALMLQSEAVNILANGFDTLFSSAGEGFKGMIDTMIDGMKRLVAEYLAKAAVLFLIRALFPASVAAEGATKGLQGMGLGKLMGFASGGMVFGPQLAMVGENSSRANPEVIMPMNKLASIMGGQIIKVDGRIKGKDIALVLRRNG